MKKWQFLFVVIFFYLWSNNAFSQSGEIYDILSHTPPSGWVKDTGNSFVAYTVINNKNGEFARIIVYKSQPGSGNPEKYFETEWNELVLRNYQPGQFTQMSEDKLKDGWIAKTGIAPYAFNNQQQWVALTMLLKNTTKLSLVFATNTSTYNSDYENYKNSIIINENSVESASGSKKTGVVNTQNFSGTANEKPAGNQSARMDNFDRRLIGKWNRSSAIHPHYADAASWGASGYTKSRYEFKADGTYLYTERSYWLLHTAIILVKENGRFSANGNLLTVSPENSVIESYTKKNNVDELGAMISSENRKPEVVTYTFAFHYFQGIQEWNLVLQAPQPTQRDGKFSSNHTYPNAWYFDQKYIENDLTSSNGK
jgi:hypothetical protein